MNPTNNSKAKNGRGTINGIKNAITARSTSPAKMFPNRRNANDKIFDSSEIISKNPKKK